jgi:hypothetical protein
LGLLILGKEKKDDASEAMERILKELESLRRDIARLEKMIKQGEG